MTMRKVEPKSFDELGEAIGPAKADSKKSYPTMRIPLAHLKEAKKWEVGKEYMVALKLKMTGLSISRFQNDAEFDIIGIDPEHSHDE